MLASWEAKYSIPSSVERVVLEPSDRADAFLVRCVALNLAILRAGLRLYFPRVILKFLPFWGITPT